MKKLYRVTFDIWIDESATRQEILDWIGFELGIRGEIEIANPLFNTDLEAEYLTSVEKEGESDET